MGLVGGGGTPTSSWTQQTLNGNEPWVHAITRQVLDIEGNVLRVVDARGNVAESRGVRDGWRGVRCGLGRRRVATDVGECRGGAAAGVERAGVREPGAVRCAAAGDARVRDAEPGGGVDREWCGRRDALRGAWKCGRSASAWLRWSGSRRRTKSRRRGLRRRPTSATSSRERATRLAAPSRAAPST